MSEAHAHAHPPQGKKLVSHGVKYSKKDVLLLHTYFAELDKNGNGKVESSDLVMSYQNKTTKLPLQNIEVIRALDINHDGIVTFQELLRRIYPLATGKELEIMFKWAYPDPGAPKVIIFEPSPAQMEELQGIFCIWDSNHDKVLDVKEILALGKATGYDEDEISALFKGADSNADNHLSFDEFVQLMKDSYIGQ